MDLVLDAELSKHASCAGSSTCLLDLVNGCIPIQKLSIWLLRHRRDALRPLGNAVDNIFE